MNEDILMNKQPIIDLINQIEQKQQDLMKELTTIKCTDRFKTAARRARSISIELTKLYKQYRVDSVALSKESTHD